MANNIGLLIKKIAESKGLTQQQLGSKINRTKQAVGSMYKRSTIEVDLLAQISDALDYDFFAHLYESAYLKKFKEKELKEQHDLIKNLQEHIEILQENLKTANDMILLQNKYIDKIDLKKD